MPHQKIQLLRLLFAFFLFFFFSFFLSFFLSFFFLFFFDQSRCYFMLRPSCYGCIDQDRRGHSLDVAGHLNGSWRGRGSGVGVSGRTAQLASAARQQTGRARLILNRSAELSWHRLAGLGGRLSGYF